MPRNTLHRLILAALFVMGTRVSMADQTSSSGAGGRGYATTVTSVPGRSSDDGLAHPGFSIQGAGSKGITSAGVPGSTNPGMEDFHAAGMGRVITAGIGRSTNDTVPGKSINYVPIVSGTRVAPVVGGRGL